MASAPVTRPVSQSDILPFERCPTLWHATRILGLDAGNRFSRIGTACHVGCDAVTRAVLGEDGRALYLVARDAVTAHANAVDLPSDEMHEALDIMDSATDERSAISFYVPDGWTACGRTELFVGEDFATIPPCGNCGGTVPEELSPPCRNCAAHHGLERPVTYRDVVDRLQWSDDGKLEVWDWSGSHDYVSGEELRLDVKARWDAMLALAWFQAAHTVTFRRVMLRLGYTASAKFVRGERWHGQIQDRARRLRSAVAKLGPLDATLSGLLTERYGKWCKQCPVREKCCTFAFATVTHGTNWSNVPRDAKARRLGVLRVAVAELDEQLRDDVTANGPIPLGDGTALGFFPKKSSALRGDRAEVLAELRRSGMDEDHEREWFAPSDRAMPGLVKDAIEKIEKTAGARATLAERVLAAATGFQFEVKEVDSE